MNSYWGGLHTNDASAHHARYTNGEAVNAVLATDGSGSGLDADKLDGQQASAFATADHGHAMLPIAIGVISSNGNVISATGNVTSRGWDEFMRCYEISIAGHSYDRDSYVTVVMDTANVGTFYTNDIELNHRDVCLQFINPDEERLQFGFKFVIFKT